MSGLKIGFIGGGQMASALSAGFLNAGICSKENIILSDPTEIAAQKAKEKGFLFTFDNKEVVKFADVVIMAVKPYVVPKVLEGIKDVWGPSKLMVSICAGVTLATFESVLGSSARVSRVMPNTPALVGCGASAVSGNQGATEADVDLVVKLMQAVGTAYKVEEKLIDAVTGLSGSGPAFVYMFIEALSDAGVKNGLPRDIASGLAAQTVLGSAKMVLETKLHPAVLKEQVTSPGGTTIAGVAALEREGLRNAVISAVDDATKRAQELGKH